MLYEYFAEQRMKFSAVAPEQSHLILLSATMSEKVERFVAYSSLDKPLKVLVNTNQTVAFNLHQGFIRIHRKFKTKPNGEYGDGEDGNE